MDISEFGKTHEKIFRIGIGTYGHGTAYGNRIKDSYGILEKAINLFPDHAKVFIDTAPLYGSGTTESIIGDLLNNGYAEKLLVATKGGREITEKSFNRKCFASDFIRNDFLRSLDRLKTDRIFLYQLHNPSLAEIKENSLFELLEDFIEQGLLQYYGVSIDSPTEGIEIVDYSASLNYQGFTSLNVIYNILNKSAELTLFKKALSHNIAIIAREPLLRGFLAKRLIGEKFDQPEGIAAAVKKILNLYGRDQISDSLQKINALLEAYSCNENMIQVALGFALFNPAISVTIPGISRIEYIDEDLNMEDFKLPVSLMENLKKISDLQEI